MPYPCKGMSRTEAELRISLLIADKLGVVTDPVKIGKFIADNWSQLHGYAHVIHNDDQAAQARAAAVLKGPATNT